MSRYLESGAPRNLENGQPRLLESGPGVPQNVVATATGKTTITVTWTAFTGATGYDIERDAVIVAANHPASPFNDSGLTPDTEYTYRVRALL